MRQNIGFFVIAHGTNDAASFRVKNNGSFEFDLTKYARQTVHWQYARVCVHTHLHTYARRTNVSHYYAEQRPLSVSDGRERAREIDWHAPAQYDKRRAYVIDIRTRRAAPHCVVYENRIVGNNAVYARK